MFCRRIIFLVALLMTTVVVAQQSPELAVGSNYVLTIPSVNYLGIPGYYHQAVIQYQPATGMWALSQKYRAVKAGVTKVEVVATTERPVQILLKVEGLRGACAEIGDAAIKLDSSNFTVYVYITDETAYPKVPVICADMMVPYTKVVPLPVYGLPAGKYTYSVNGFLSGSFDLSSNNTLP
jgi:hypothetical protein